MTARRKFCAGAAVFTIITSVLMALAMNTTSTVKTFGISMLFFGAISGYGLAMNIYKPQEPESASGTQTREQMRIDADAHSVSHEDFIAQGGDHLSRTLP